MKDNYDIRTYYWVAEAQKNENIHFHVLLDRFIEMEWVRKYWNGRLELLGYIDEFEKVHGHRKAPTEQVATIKQLANSSRYVTKYVTKTDEHRGLQGRLHGISDLLRGFSAFKTDDTERVEYAAKRAVKEGILRELENDKCRLYVGDIRLALQKYERDLHAEWRDWNVQNIQRMYSN
jgi:hypothetical protein